MPIKLKASYKNNNNIWGQTSEVLRMCLPLTEVSTIIKPNPSVAINLEQESIDFDFVDINHSSICGVENPFKYQRSPILHFFSGYYPSSSSSDVPKVNLLYREINMFFDMLSETTGIPKANLPIVVFIFTSYNQFSTRKFRRFINKVREDISPNVFEFFFEHALAEHNDLRKDLIQVIRRKLNTIVVKAIFVRNVSLLSFSDFLQHSYLVNNTDVENELNMQLFNVFNYYFITKLSYIQELEKFNQNDQILALKSKNINQMITLTYDFLKNHSFFKLLVFFKFPFEETFSFNNNNVGGTLKTIERKQGLYLCVETALENLQKNFETQFQTTANVKVFNLLEPFSPANLKEKQPILVDSQAECCQFLSVLEIRYLLFMMNFQLLIEQNRFIDATKEAEEFLKVVSSDMKLWIGLFNGKPEFDLIEFVNLTESFMFSFCINIYEILNEKTAAFFDYISNAYSKRRTDSKKEISEKKRKRVQEHRNFFNSLGSLLLSARSSLCRLEEVFARAAKSEGQRLSPRSRRFSLSLQQDTPLKLLQQDKPERSNTPLPMKAERPMRVLQGQHFDSELMVFHPYIESNGEKLNWFDHVHKDTFDQLWRWITEEARSRFSLNRRRFCLRLDSEIADFDAERGDFKQACAKYRTLISSDTLTHFPILQSVFLRQYIELVRQNNLVDAKQLSFTDDDAEMDIEKDYFLAVNPKYFAEGLSLVDWIRKMKNNGCLTCDSVSRFNSFQTQFFREIIKRTEHVSDLVPIEKELSNMFSVELCLKSKDRVYVGGCATLVIMLSSHWDFDDYDVEVEGEQNIVFDVLSTKISCPYSADVTVKMELPLNNGGTYNITEIGLSMFGFSFVVPVQPITFPVHSVDPGELVECECDIPIIGVPCLIAFSIKDRTAPICEVPVSFIGFEEKDTVIPFEDQKLLLTPLQTECSIMFGSKKIELNCADIICDTLVHFECPLFFVSCDISCSRPCRLSSIELVLENDQNESYVPFSKVDDIHNIRSLFFEIPAKDFSFSSGEVRMSVVFEGVEPHPYVVSMERIIPVVFPTENQCMHSLIFESCASLEINQFLSAKFIAPYDGVLKMETTDEWFPLGKNIHVLSKGDSLSLFFAPLKLQMLQFPDVYFNEVLQTTPDMICVTVPRLQVIEAKKEAMSSHDT
ncbi:hypothetical protein PCE1_003975 [Barthelona sp. PCE]